MLRSLQNSQIARGITIHVLLGTNEVWIINSFSWKEIQSQARHFEQKFNISVLFASTSWMPCFHIHENPLRQTNFLINCRRVWIPLLIQQIRLIWELDKILIAFTESWYVVTFNNNFLKRFFLFYTKLLICFYSNTLNFESKLFIFFFFFSVNDTNPEALDIRKFVRNIIWNKTEPVNRWTTKG